MYDLNEVQPISNYVRALLEDAKNRYNISIDLKNPTRGQRLEAAIAMKDKASGLNSMEIMVGERIDSGDPRTALLLMQLISPQEPREFYAGFRHDYWTKEE